MDEMDEEKDEKLSELLMSMELREEARIMQEVINLAE